MPILGLDAGGRTIELKPKTEILLFLNQGILHTEDESKQNHERT
jgi:hypothetical protein